MQQTKRKANAGEPKRIRVRWLGTDHTIKPAHSKKVCHPGEAAAATDEGPAFRELSKSVNQRFIP
jgi:hypothetical protein